jgi:hypothetical protein
MAVTGRVRAPPARPAEKLRRDSFRGWKIPARRTTRKAGRVVDGPSVVYQKCLGALGGSGTSETPH